MDQQTTLWASWVIEQAVVAHDSSVKRVAVYHAGYEIDPICIFGKHSFLVACLETQAIIPHEGHVRSSKASIPLPITFIHELTMMT